MVNIIIDVTNVQLKNLFNKNFELTSDFISIMSNKKIKINNIQALTSLKTYNIQYIDLVTFRIKFEFDSDYSFFISSGLDVAFTKLKSEGFITYLQKDFKF